MIDVVPARASPVKDVVLGGFQTCANPIPRGCGGLVTESNDSDQGEPAPAARDAAGPAATPEGEAAVEVHHAHPVKSWREFVTEIGVIVVGILVALALDQAAERYQEHRFAAEARDAVRAEVSENLYWVDLRQRAEPCIGRRLQEIGAILDLAEQGKAHPVPRRLGMVPHIKLTELRWQANASGGRASLFSGDEQRLFDNYYFSTDQLLQYQAQEENVWSGLRALQGESRLTPETIHDFRKLLAQAKYYNWRILFLISHAHQWGEQMHLTPYSPGNIDKADSGAAAAGLCAPIDAPPPPLPPGTLIGGFGPPEDMP
jgi:hypothetical protein